MRSGFTKARHLPQAMNPPKKSGTSKPIYAFRSFTAGPGSYTAIQDCDVVVGIVGGGGAAGLASEGQECGGGGGGAALKRFPMRRGQTFNYNVGAGGVRSWGNGGDTTLTTPAGLVVVATGGKGALTQLAGVGINGDINRTGGAGGLVGSNGSAGEFGGVGGLGNGSNRTGGGGAAGFNDIFPLFLVGRGAAPGEGMPATGAVYWPGGGSGGGTIADGSDGGPGAIYFIVSAATA